MSLKLGAPAYLQNGIKVYILEIREDLIRVQFVALKNHRTAWLKKAQLTDDNKNATVRQQ